MSGEDRPEERIRGILTEEQERRFKAQAWRHCRRINPKMARKVWLAVRRGKLAEAA